MNYLLPLVAFINTVIFCFILSIFAKKLKLIDIPTKRKIHKNSTPVVGGIGIFLSIYSLLFFIDYTYQIKILIFATAIVLIIGALDDALQLGVRLRLVLQVITSLIVMGAGIVITDLGEYTYFAGFLVL